MLLRPGSIVSCAVILPLIHACAGGGSAPRVAPVGVAAAISYGSQVIQTAPGTVSGCQVAFCMEADGCRLCSTGDPSGDKGCQAWGACVGATADTQLGAGEICSQDGCLPSGCFPAYCYPDTGLCVICDDGDPATADSCVESAPNPCGYKGAIATPDAGAEPSPPADAAVLDVAPEAPPEVAPEVTPEACVPDCAGKECGSDGCGGYCGSSCMSLTESDCFSRKCIDFKCVAVVLSCDDGNPATDDWCTLKNGCKHKPVDGCHPACAASGCAPDGTGLGCNLKACGPDGCGGSCGDCAVSNSRCLLTSCDPATGGCRQDERDCDDGDPATADFCSPLLGCEHVRVPRPITLEFGSAEGASAPDASEPDVPAMAETPVATDLPGTSDSPTAVDAPAALDAPVALDVPGPGTCVPHCCGKVCGPDGCGGWCGECPAESPFGPCGPFACEDGHCVVRPVVCPAGDTCDPFTGDCGPCQVGGDDGCPASCQDVVDECIQRCSRCSTCEKECEGLRPECERGCRLSGCEKHCADQGNDCATECPSHDESCAKHCGDHGMDCERVCKLKDCSKHCDGQGKDCEQACKPAGCEKHCQDQGNDCATVCPAKDDACRKHCEDHGNDCAHACAPKTCEASCADGDAECLAACAPDGCEVPAGGNDSPKPGDCNGKPAKGADGRAHGHGHAPRW